MLWRHENGWHSLQRDCSGQRKSMKNFYLLLVLTTCLFSLASAGEFREDISENEDEEDRRDFLRNLLDEWRDDDSSRQYDTPGFDTSRSEYERDAVFQRSSLSEDQIFDELRHELVEAERSYSDQREEYGSQQKDERNGQDAEYSNIDSENQNLLDEILAHFEIDIFKTTDSKDNLNSIKVENFLKTYQKELSGWRRKDGLGAWKKETNLTTYNIEQSKKLSLEMSDWAKKRRLEADKFSKDGLTYNQKRMLKFITDTDALMQDELEKKEVNLSSKISAIYSKAQVCKTSTRKCYHFEPGLIKIMRTSRDYDELIWAWKGWRDAIGPKIRTDWIEAMKLSNEGAKEHDYHDVGEYQRHQYEDPNFEKDIDDLWVKIEPIYKQLHAYVRYKLHQQYGDRVPLDKPIPAHLLGDMWAMKWDGILNLVTPFPDVEPFDVTNGMKKKNMTVMDMFHLADHFYRSIGLPKMTPEFWDNSMFVRPKDNRSVVCYASAHNLEKDDVRVKMCASVTGEYLYVVHHEMGHCQYYLAYNRHQPALFQSGANHGFHEAIGDTAALSVISPTHLEKLKIIDSNKGTQTEQRQRDINFLMQKALGKLVFYPFALTMAKWNWNVYSGKIKTENLNAEWWKYRKQYQGLVPPVERSEKDFDPGSKYHITNFVPYVRYFISHVLQFQFYEALCDLAKFQGLLHKCDFAGSLDAGEKFQKMLEMGSSKPWPEALKELTGTKKMNVDSIEKYFRPLITWLKAENKRLGNKIGWD